jgi:hypothetical protein
MLLVCACSYGLRKRRLMQMSQIHTQRPIFVAATSTSNTPYPLGTSIYTNRIPDYQTYIPAPQDYYDSTLDPPSYTTVIEQSKKYPTEKV